jgi:hypothetical protein
MLEGLDWAEIDAAEKAACVHTSQDDVKIEVDAQAAPVSNEAQGSKQAKLSIQAQTAPVSKKAQCSKQAKVRNQAQAVQQQEQRQSPQQRGVIPEGAGPSMSQLVGLQQELRAKMGQFQMQLMQETTAIHEEAAAGRIPQEQAQQQIEQRRQLYGHQIQVLQQHDHLQQQMIMQKQQQLQMQHGMQEDDSKSQHQGLQGGHQQMLQVQAVAVSQQLHVRLHQVHYTQQQPNMSLEQKQAAIQQLWQKQEQEAVYVTQQFQTQQHHLPPAAASGGPSAVAPTGV